MLRYETKEGRYIIQHKTSLCTRYTVTFPSGDSTAHCATVGLRSLLKMLLEILLGLLALFLILYRYVTKNFGKWKDLGIPYAKGSFPFGSYNFLGGDSIDTMNAKLCQEFQNERYFGTFLFGKPSLHINDPDLLRLIQVKDFDHFVDRTSPSDNKKFFSGGDNDKVETREELFSGIFHYCRSSDHVPQ